MKLLINLMALDPQIDACVFDGEPRAPGEHLSTEKKPFLGSNLPLTLVT